MKSRLLNSLTIAIATALMIASGSAFAAESLGNAAALQGVKQVKSVFLIKADGISQTDSTMKAIRGTHKGLLEQGVQSQVVVGNGFISLIGWQTQGYVPMTF